MLYVERYVEMVICKEFVYFYRFFLFIFYVYTCVCTLRTYVHTYIYARARTHKIDAFKSIYESLTFTNIHLIQFDSISNKKLSCQKMKTKRYNEYNRNSRNGMHLVISRNVIIGHINKSNCNNTNLTMSW